MRIILFLLIMLSDFVLCADYSGAKGQNQLGEAIWFEEFYANSSGQGVWKIHLGKEIYEPLETYDLLEECPNILLTSYGESFTCREGKSPLSGTRYLITSLETYTPCESVDDMSPGTVYQCESGCGNPRVPKILYVEPYECAG
jgi:hypothetical protein